MHQTSSQWSLWNSNPTVRKDFQLEFSNNQLLFKEKKFQSIFIYCAFEKVFSSLFSCWRKFSDCSFVICYFYINSSRQYIIAQTNIFKHVFKTITIYRLILSAIHQSSFLLVNAQKKLDCVMHWMHQNAKSKNQFPWHFFPNMSMLLETQKRSWFEGTVLFCWKWKFWSKEV